MKFRTTLALALLTLSTISSAAYPDKPVRLVVPYPAGGPTDVAARLITGELQKRLGQSFVVENRAGAGGNVGAEFVAKAASDGYTLLMLGAAHAINKSLYKNLTYDVQRDFAPIATFSSAPLALLAYPGAGVNSVQEMISMAKAKPAALSYCSSGAGTAPHLAMEMLKAKAGINMVHIPYRGSAPGITDLIAGQVQVCFDSMVVWQQYAGSGRLKALAISGTQRSDISPELPTMAEAGMPLDLSVWYGIVAPTRTPDAVLQTLNASLREILQDPAVRDRLRGLGAATFYKTTGDFRTFLDKEIAMWAEVVKFSGAVVE